jgi:hypothetical protein
MHTIKASRTKHIKIKYTKVHAFISDIVDVYFLNKYLKKNLCFFKLKDEIIVILVGITN